MREVTVEVLRATSSHHRPMNIALAVGLGIMAGASASSPVLLIAYLLAALFLPTHLFLFALVGSLSAAMTLTFSEWFGSLGTWLLSQPVVARFVAAVESTPLLSWLLLSNSVVYGSVFVGTVVSLGCSTIAWICARAIQPIAKPETRIKSVFEELPPVEFHAQAEVPDFVLLPSEDASLSIAEESFVELSEADMELLSRLDQSHGAVPDATRSPSVMSPATNPEADMTQEADDSQARLDKGAEAVNAAAENLLSFDPAERLEELLSGCRVQPHWTESGSSSDNQVVSDERSHDSDAAAADEVLERSAEMLGLVDELMSQIETEDENSERQFRADVGVESVEVEETDELPPAILPASQPSSVDTVSPIGRRIDAAEVPDPQMDTSTGPIIESTQSESAQIEGTKGEARTAASSQPKYSMQTGHDEALRYLLRHLQSKESRTQSKASDSE